LGKIINQVQIIENLASGNIKTIAKTLSMVENQLSGAAELLLQLSFSKNIPIIGITGPPGAGKSSLVNSCIAHLLVENKKIAVLAVDPSSPFNYGSLLGDRIRMQSHFNNPNVFIRSVASRGHLGGLSSRIYEMCDVLRNCNFDYIFIETVGVGQSEVEIAGIADITIVVLVPESGDEIQAMKSGVMEIADIFAINKSDREGANKFTQTLKKLLHHQSKDAEIVQTIAIKNEGTKKLFAAIQKKYIAQQINEQKAHLLANRAWQLMASNLMKKYNYLDLLEEIKIAQTKQNFNLYRFIKNKLT